MNSKIKIVLLLFLVVNSLWAMSRLGPLSNQFLSGLRRSAPGDASLASRRLLSTSLSSLQPRPGVSMVPKGTGYRGQTGIARRIALLEKKMEQVKKEEVPKVSLLSRLQAFDKKMHEKFKESFVGTSLLGIGLMIGGRSLYDKYIANKDIKPELSNTSSVDVVPKNSDTQKEQPNWGDFLANKWNAFTSGIMGQ